MGFGVAILIIILISVAIWVLVEFRRFKHKMFAIFLIFLILFGYFSYLHVFSDRPADLKTVSGLMSASKIYFSWLGGVLGNLKSLTTNAIKMNWDSLNKTSQK